MPPGAAVPDEWVPLQSRRIEPEVAPRSPAAGTGAADQGRGGAAFVLRAAPRHREVLRRFFDAGERR